MVGNLLSSVAVIGCLLASTAFPGFATQYWVAQGHPAASDDNPGTVAAPWKTLTKAVSMLQPGDTLTIAAGIYRESIILKAEGTPEAPITIQAAALQEDGYEPVVITGADIITDWRPLPGRPIWVHEPWTHVWCGWKADMAHGAPPPIGRCEQVIVDGSDSEPGRLLIPVLSIDEMAPGTFFADPKDSRSLYIRLPDDSEPRAHRIEASVRSVVVKAGAYTNIRGLTVRYAANRAQEGALQMSGTGWMLEDCIVEWTNGAGVGVGGSNYIMRRCVTRYNGQLGLGGSGTNCLLERCRFEHNNVKGFPAQWEAGGFKICKSHGVKVLESQALSNNGVGMWFDIDNSAGVVRQCYCYDNTCSGIFIEISSDFVIADNLCVGNGGNDKGDWAGAGIAIAESDDCYVAFNTCVGNQYGVSIRGQVPRAGPQGRVYTCKGVTIRNNLLAYNTVAQFGLCWDNVFFGRHPNDRDLSEADWQKKVAEHSVDPGRIQLLLDHNFYAPKWKPYTDLRSLYDEHGLERSGQVGRPLFVDQLGGDFRLLPDSPAIKFGAGMRYPAAGMGEVVVP